MLSNRISGTLSWSIVKNPNKKQDKMWKRFRKMNTAATHCSLLMLPSQRCLFFFVCFFDIFSHGWSLGYWRAVSLRMLKSHSNQAQSRALCPADQRGLNAQVQLNAPWLLPPISMDAMHQRLACHSTHFQRSAEETEKCPVQRSAASQRWDNTRASMQQHTSSRRGPKGVGRCKHLKGQLWAG